MRIGDPAGLNTSNTVPGTALPIFLDYYEVDDVNTPYRETKMGRRWLTVPVPSDGQAACTLSYASAMDGTPGSTDVMWGRDAEGSPSHDTTSTSMFWGCYSTPAGQALGGDGNTHRKVIGLVNRAGIVDTSTSFRAFEGRRGSASGFKAVWSSDARSFYVAGIGDTLYGLRYLARRTDTATSRIYGSTSYASGAYQLGTLDIRGVAAQGGYVFMTSSATVERSATEGPLVMIGTANPTGSVGSADVSQLAGLAGVASQRSKNLYGLAFEYDGKTLYVIEDRSTYVRAGGSESRPEYVRTSLGSAILKYVRTTVNGALTWSQDTAFTIPLPAGEACYGLKGRYRDGMQLGPFMLYTSSKANMYEINTDRADPSLPKSSRVRLVATAEPGTQFRGVGLMPGVPRNTPAATRSKTASGSVTRSRSKKAKLQQ